ncbi:hypothetical protein ACGFX4_29305 [Kitasatospora sp. NPDC048365]|uniref:hypothetical protein n=1 Tax=Kitasatospora sp. NPDC048365 TaxID=3364050 RepID=UPI00371FE0D2
MSQWLVSIPTRTPEGRNGQHVFVVESPHGRTARHEAEAYAQTAAACRHRRFTPLDPAGQVTVEAATTGGLDRYR